MPPKAKLKVEYLAELLKGEPEELLKQPRKEQGWLVAALIVLKGHCSATGEIYSRNQNELICQLLPGIRQKARVVAGAMARDGLVEKIGKSNKPRRVIMNPHLSAVLRAAGYKGELNFDLNGPAPEI